MTFKKTLLAATILPLMLAACNGDDGKDGIPGKDGASGTDGATGQDGASGQNGIPALVKQTPLSNGHIQCAEGGLMVESGIDTNTNNTLDSNEIQNTSFICNQNTQTYFKRIATYPVCMQLDDTCDTDDETVAEIAAASEDGNLVFYTDGGQSSIGGIDITDPANPKGFGIFNVGGEPTSVAVSGDYVLAGVNTSESFTTPSGRLLVGALPAGVPSDANPINIERAIELGGQPDSVAVSKDGRFAVVVIENERDEDLTVDGIEGGLPQLPAGKLVVIKTEGAPANWMAADVDLTGLADKFPSDPEPEYADINDNNIAVVTLQENNHIVLVDLEKVQFGYLMESLETAKTAKKMRPEILNHFSAGTVNLAAIDTEEEDHITLTSSLTDVPREPDGVTWINNDFLATADEGDFEGGSRGFTVFNTLGKVVYSSANELEHLTVRFGHYPEGRSENKGNEPENAEVGQFGDDKYLFVASERSSLIFVYDVNDADTPVYKQTLPAAAGPEGILAIPSRNLLIASSEKDDRGDKLRGGINVYQYGSNKNAYPSLQSANDTNGNPISWAAMSGLSAGEADTLYAVEDSAFIKSRLFKIDTSKSPALITDAMMMKDDNDILANLTTVSVADDSGSKDDARKDVFDSEDLKNLINDDKTINIDPEGIATAADGGFWVVSEGSGTVGDSKKPVNSPNLLLKLDANAVVTAAHRLPATLEGVQLRFGFEGVTEFEGNVYVAMQRAWDNEETVRIARFAPADSSWNFFNYRLDDAESQNGGWVGLSDITSLGNNQFLVMERDNQGGPDAAIKRLYRIDLTGKNDGDTVEKTLVRDLMDDLTSQNNLPFEKVEGLAVTADGNVFIINDNDGVDDNSGETQLLDLGKILD
ncbi:Uncharacterised protein [BD1-7 clade bacterium]|uniref:Phytase-like domain-containing protein n=1 Tax=BD1-7 clade bacterium TaxID=2029982 RepID=A0A5S9MSP8_9GAMM|nr:Uncharacterised protein [BD1-7 clade bacterium]CAA0085326.1 Uncharacterised protein [BD1-7 clade bacterium]